MKSPSILEKFNVKLCKNAKSECYCIFNKRETSFLIEIWITSTSISSRGFSLSAMFLYQGPGLKLLSGLLAIGGQSCGMA